VIAVELDNGAAGSTMEEGRATRPRLALPGHWAGLDHLVEFPLRALLIVAGLLPVTLIAASTFEIVGLRALATYVLAPVIVTAAYLVARRRAVSTLVRKAIGAGIVATALYDLVRFSFLWTGLMSQDPIPHIGVALGLHPAWVFGYLWRYVGNGGGLAVTFWALGLRGVRRGALFGLLVCSGLLALLVVCPHAQAVLFPLTWATVVMATVGHAVYGAALGAMTVGISHHDPRTLAQADLGSPVLTVSRGCLQPHCHRRRPFGLRVLYSGEGPRTAATRSAAHSGSNGMPDMSRR
jgi:hypothetical protein